MRIKIYRLLWLFVFLLASACAAAPDTPGLDTPPPPNPTQTEELAPTPEASEPAVDGSAYWVEAVDPRTGVRFAVPCFWEVKVPAPEQDPSGIGSFPVQNFTDEFVMSFGNKGGDLIWENGAMKIDFLYFAPEIWGMSPGVSAREFAEGMPEDEDIQIRDRVDDVRINGQDGVVITSHDSFDGSTSQYYIFQLTDELYFGFAPVPNMAIYSPDVQAILHSLALSPDAELVMPDIVPAAPPEGVPAECLEGAERPPASDSLGLLPYGASFYDPASLAVSIQSGLLAGNLPALKALMTDPFQVGYWGSEWRSVNPAEAIIELGGGRLPADPSTLTFTIDLDLFPPLAGQPVQSMFGPNVPIVLAVYSEGWGPDGEGAAILFISTDEQLNNVWYGILYAMGHFDK